MSDAALIRPDFIIVGAMKSGTTTLAAQLGGQEGVFMTKPKEPNFFSDDAVYAQGLAWYSDLFASAAPGDIKGEASTHYTKLPTYPNTLPRMAQYLDQVRIIYMIRNPLARAVSHYIHAWSEGQAGSDPDHAFEHMPQMVEYGCYAAQIRPYIDAFGSENVMLTSLEQIKADPDTTFDRITAFLELPTGTHWDHSLEAQNVSQERVRKLPLQGLLVDNPVARALRHALVPKAFRTWVRRQRTITTKPEIPDHLRRAMKTRFLADRAILAELFPDHPALTLCYPFADHAH